VFAEAVRHSYIDDLVLKKLKTLTFRRPPQCNDHEFIRRAFLDAAGVLPTPEEIKAFPRRQSPRQSERS